MSNEGTKIKHTFLKKHPTFSSGLCAFCVIAASIALYFIFLRLNEVSAIFNKFFTIIAPINYGLVIAFLLNPIMNSFEKLFAKLTKDKSKVDKRKPIYRGTSIVIAIVIVFFLIYLISSFVFPELINSIKKISGTIPQKLDVFNKYLDNKIMSNSIVADYVNKIFDYANENSAAWIKDNITSKLNVYMDYISFGISSIVKVAFNIVIGLACSIYLLYNKEKFLAQCKKLLFVLFKPKSAKKTISISKESLDIFTHSVIGKIIDSILIGIICYLGMKLFAMPYPVLIGVIIGITNFIPMFGPWIGGMPCGALIFLTEPKQTLLFAIFVLCLQQFDANFLTPKIVGNYIGLPAFWVIVACLLGGGFFGVLGLILSVPIFGILYHLFGRLIAKKLENKNLPSKTEDYLIPGEELEEKIQS